MDTTICPNCHNTMATDEYLDAERCPYCGRNFALNYYRAATSLGALFAVVAWLYYFIKPSRTVLVGAVIMTCFGFGFAGLTITIDVLLLHTTNLSKRNRRRLTGWLTVIIIILTALFTIDYVKSLSNE